MVIIILRVSGGLPKERSDGAFLDSMIRHTVLVEIISIVVADIDIFIAHLPPS